MALKSNYLLAASLLLPLLARADHHRADHHIRKSEDSRSYFAVASSPYDVSCVKSVLSGGNEDSCTATVDQDGHPCLWCDAGEGQGLCLTDNQAEIAQQIGIQCGENEAIEGSPYDISCAVAMFSGGDESSCTNTEDQDGQPCVWCLASADQGLCVTEQQSEIAQQMGIQCGESTTEDDEDEDEDDEYEEDDEDYDEDEEEEEDDEEDVAGSPYDVSCIITTLTGGDEGACTSTEDQDGEACVWCLASAGQGLCVTEQQSEIAQQAGIQCGSSTTEGDEEEAEEDDKEEDDDIAGSPYDVSCILTTLSGGDEGSCKATEDQDGEACVWCEASADQGLCLTEEQSEIAQQAGIQCGQRLDGAMFEETALE